MGFVEPGVDICEISRIQEAVDKHPAFKHRIFTSEEITQSEQVEGSLRYRRFTDCYAGKEAVAKAIGGIPHKFMDIVITRNEEDKPEVELRGKARQWAGERGILHISLSFSQIKDEVIAVCIAEG